MNALIHILYSKTTDSFTDKMFESNLSYLSECDIIKIKSFYKYSDKKASLLGRLLLMKGLELYNIEKSVIKSIKRDNYNKPFIPNLDIHFNISHSNEYVICALSQDGRIGIDIEYMKDIDINHFKSILTNKEWLVLHSSINSIHKLYDIWVTKEAFLKAIGTGLVSDINRIESSSIKENKYLDLFYFNIQIEDFYKAALVTTCQFPEIKLNQINFLKNIT